MAAGLHEPNRGHLGQDKTIARVAQWFFWLGLEEEITRLCAACPECQMIREDHPAQALLQPLPINGVPFSQIEMDVMGSLPQSSIWHQYILVFIDYATHYPELIPCQAVTAPQITKDLIKWIVWVGIPKEILTKQGQNFMSGVLLIIWHTLQIKHLNTSMYHPQTNGIMEHLNGTIKRKLQWCIQGKP